MNLTAGIDQSNVGFGTNLGVATAPCDHRDVSGTRRFKYFTSALSVLPGQDQEFNDSENQSISDPQDMVTATYTDFGTQTEEIFCRKLSLDEEKILFMKEIPELVSIQKKRRQLEVERRNQMTKIPAKMEEQTWAENLEENRRKDFALREKELDLVIQYKMMLTKRALHGKEPHGENWNQKDSRALNTSNKSCEEQDVNNVCCNAKSEKDETIANSYCVPEKMEETLRWKTSSKKVQRKGLYSVREVKDHCKDLDLISSIFEKKYGS